MSDTLKWMFNWWKDDTENEDHSSQNATHRAKRRVFSDRYHKGTSNISWIHRINSIIKCSSTTLQSKWDLWFTKFLISIFIFSKTALTI